MAAPARVPAGYRGVSPEALREHYGLHDDFFRIWLGPSLAYSSGLWTGAQNLEEAQANKAEYLLRQSGVQAGDRVLDIGCGYGTEVRHFVEHGDIAEAVGITLSESQVDWLRAHDVPRFRAHLQNWIDHRPARPYDAIICVEAFEHFARPGMSGRRKTQGYRKFFERCRAMVEPDGALVVQTITWGRRFPVDLDFLKTLYLATKVYPECNPAYLVEVIGACDGLFDLVELRNDHDHYSRTAAAWVANLEAEWGRAVELVGEQKVADFHRCMSAAVRAFAEGWFYLHRMTFRPVRKPTRPARRFFVNNVLGRGPG